MTALTKFASQTEYLRYIQECAEISEEHAHHICRWYGIRAPQTATEWASATTLTPYVCISGAGTWGAEANDEAKVFGTDDVLWDEDFSMGDFDEILFVANTSTTLYRFRMIWGSAAQSMADAIAAGQYSEALFIRGNTDNVRIPRVMKTELIGITAQIWAQCMNATDNATLSFLVGVHGYDFSTTYHTPDVG